MSDRHELAGTEQTHGPLTALDTVPLRRQTRARATIVLRSRAGDAAIDAAVAELAEQLPHQRRQFRPREFAKEYGADPASVAAVVAHARRRGLRVAETSAPRRFVEVSGTLKQLQEAFGVEFVGIRHPRRNYRSFEGAVSVSASVAEYVEDVLGLDNRPIAVPMAAAAAGPPEMRFTDPRDVAAAYSFPEGAGRGQCVGILEFGGGYHRSDMHRYFAARGLGGRPAVHAYSIDGARNRPAPAALIREVAEQFHLWTDPTGAPAAGGGAARPAPGLDHEATTAFWQTVESTMDPQLVATLVPDAQTVVYFAPDTARGKFHALTAVIEGRVYRPQVLSISWGSCENQLPGHVMRTIDRVHRLAAIRGITICASSGDFGDGRQRCGAPTGHFPASGPHTMACGGTGLKLTKRGRKEQVWNETVGPITMSSGGGYSEAFPPPAWQRAHAATADAPGRAYPDVAAKADLMSGYDLVVGGIVIPMGGTSAATPLWAALVARLNEALDHPVGFLTPLMYSRLEGCTNDIDRGSNGASRAATGWDACTGHGSPNGAALLEALRP